MPSRGVKTNRITLRLPSDILDPLKQESEERDLPLNAIINRILSKNVFYDKRMGILPTIIVPITIHSKVFENMDESKKLEIAKEGPAIVNRLFSMYNLKSTLENAIEEYFLVVSKYCGWYDFHHEKSDKKHRLVFDSNLGNSWNEFLLLYLRSILESLNITIIEQSICDSIIVFEVTDE